MAKLVAELGWNNFFHFIKQFTEKSHITYSLLGLAKKRQSCPENSFLCTNIAQHVKY
jgi:hypothetical protein